MATSSVVVQYVKDDDQMKAKKLAASTAETIRDYKMYDTPQHVHASRILTSMHNRKNSPWAYIIATLLCITVGARTDTIHVGSCQASLFVMRRIARNWKTKSLTTLRLPLPIQSCTRPSNITKSIQHAWQLRTQRILSGCIFKGWSRRLQARPSRAQMTRPRKFVPKAFPIGYCGKTHLHGG